MLSLIVGPWILSQCAFTLLDCDTWSDASRGKSSWTLGSIWFFASWSSLTSLIVDSCSSRCRMCSVSPWASWFRVDHKRNLRDHMHLSHLSANFSRWGIVFHRLRIAAVNNNILDILHTQYQIFHWIFDAILSSAVVLSLSGRHLENLIGWVWRSFQDRLKTIPVLQSLIIAGVSGLSCSVGRICWAQTGTLTSIYDNLDVDIVECDLYLRFHRIEGILVLTHNVCALFCWLAMSWTIFTYWTLRYRFATNALPSASQLIDSTTLSAQSCRFPRLDFEGGPLASNWRADSWWAVTVPCFKVNAAPNCVGNKISLSTRVSFLTLKNQRLLSTFHCAIKVKLSYAACSSWRPGMCWMSIKGRFVNRSWMSYDDEILMPFNRIP